MAVIVLVSSFVELVELNGKKKCKYVKINVSMQGFLSMLKIDINLLMIKKKLFTNSTMLMKGLRINYTNTGLTLQINCCFLTGGM